MVLAAPGPLLTSCLLIGRTFEILGGSSLCVCVYYCSTYYKTVRVGGGDSGGHVLRETTSRILCGLVCPSRTSERGGEGD